MRNKTSSRHPTRAISTLLAVSMSLATGSAGAVITTGFAAGVYTASSDAADAIVVTCGPELEGGGRLVVNINNFQIGDSIDCFSVAQFNIFGGPGDNLIDLSKVGTEFTAFTGSEIHGGAGVDDITGSRLADLIIGDTGDDGTAGLGGDDEFIWNNGDNTDDVDLGDGDDRVTVNGANNATTGDVFEIAQIASAVRLQRTNLIPFAVSMSSAEALVVNGLDGNDGINASTLPAGVIALSLNGNGGNDDIRGSLGIDAIDGGPGNDNLVGFPGIGGTEVILGGDGDDTHIWNNGDNDDHFIGGAGNDTQIVNGAPVGDQMAIGLPVAGEPGIVAFRRTNLVPFNVFLSEAENLVVNGLGGDDVINGSTLDAGLIALSLNGGDGNDDIRGSRGIDAIDGGSGNDTLVGFPGIGGTEVILGGDGDDTNIWNNGDNTDQFIGGAGNDTQIVNGAPVGDQMTMGLPVAGEPGTVAFHRTNLVPFNVFLSEAENLVVNGLAGDDVIDATPLDAGLIALSLNGGDGADQLFGSRGNDQMNGGAGDDALVGRQGDDRQTGGDGEDRFTWNNGDNTDQFFGEAGDDRAIVNGANNAATGDEFVVAQSASGARFERTNLIPFAIDIETIETLEVNSLDGADRVSTVGLADIAQVLDGGAPAAFPGDVLLVAGVADPRLSPVAIAGAALITHQNFEFEGAAIPAVPIPALDTVGASVLAAMLLLLAFTALRARPVRRA